MNSLSGCLLINKRVGYTSRDEVNVVSKTLGIKKVGHIGTLDPFASGLLIVLVGSATKISPFLEKHNKTYIASLKLGQKYDTGDLTGSIIEEKEVPALTKEKVNEVLASFLGESEQIPPMYSALKKDGKPLYKYAREGKEITREPRKINIYDIKLISFNNNVITFAVKVSKGTYIRTLGEDIAKRLGTVGHLIELERTMINNFNVTNSIRSDVVKPSDLIPIEKMLEDYPSVTLDEKLAIKALNGVALKLDSDKKEIVVKDKNGIIAMYTKSGDIYTCLRGLR